MNPTTLTASALAIALTFGAGGYFLGKNQSTSLVNVQADQTSRVVTGSPEAVPRRATLPAVDTVELRKKLDAEKNPISRFNLALDHLEAWINKNPKQALDWLASQPASERRDDVMRAALGQFAEIDAKGAADWAMGNLAGVELNNAIITIAENWATQNGKEAASWFEARPASSERDAALENLYFAWSSADPVAALAHLKASQNLGDLSSSLLRATLAGWAKTEPEAAAAYSLAASRDKDPSLFANTLANWATMDLEASAAWLLANVPAGKEREAATQELAGMYARQSPETGVTWLQELTSGPERDAAASAFASDWSRKSPADAAAWISSQSLGAISPESIAAVARNFLMKDSSAFQAWKTSLPEGPVKDAVTTVGTPSEED